MTRTVAVIQARTGSNRLPNKILEPLFADMSILAYQCQRLRQVDGVDELVLATTTNPADDVVEMLGEAEKIRVIRGSENDVLGRFLLVARQTGATTIVRITSDSPFRDPAVIAHCIAEHVKSGAQYTRPVAEHLPRGLRAEVVETRTLQALADNTEVTARDREHVTAFIREHTDQFRTHLVNFPDALHRPDYDLSVDTREDLAFVRQVYEEVVQRGWPIDVGHICRYLDETHAGQPTARAASR